jgi:hypothetical protein
VPVVRVTWRDETRRSATFEGVGKLEGRAEVEVEVEVEGKGDVLEGQGKCRDDEDDLTDTPFAASVTAAGAAASSWRTALAESPP